jgi:ferritin-like metal-binding protein YciE
MDRTTESTQARGADRSPERRPGVPMETRPAHERSASGGPTARQPERKEHLRSPDRDGLTPTFGTGPHPRAASGAMRRMAYAMPEYQARRWMLLMAADRVDVLEHRLPELLTGQRLDQLGRQVRANPVGMLTLAVGVGFMLERTRLLNVLGGALVSAVLPGNGAVERTAQEEQLLEWLNDAYAMEMALIPVLENHAEDARRHPDVRERDLEHLKETKRHAKDVKKCIERLGGKPSAGRKMIGRLTGAVNSIATEPFEDEVLKNFLMDYATEHFEIACYRSLIVAAHEAGHPKIAKVCEDILEDELDMAEWIEDNLPKAVRLTLH